MNILLLGGGGREHAMAWKISLSPLCNKLFIAPGNAGTALCGENVAISPNDHKAIGRFAVEHAIDMVVVGPEEPLVKSLGDFFASRKELEDILFMGPGSAGAQLEGSKAFAKSFMQRHNIPTAAYKAFTCDTLKDGLAFIDSLMPPYVLKADGLAAGKGVVICSTKEEAESTLNDMLCGAMFGEASRTVVIEEFLKGREMSVFVATDGNTYRILPAAKDYKRVGEKDTGANTGGMGSISPVPFASHQLMNRIEQRIILPTIDGLKSEGIPYCGFIFFGLMVVGQEPYVIEYNVRLGDPEAEAILSRVDSDFAELIQLCCQGRLHEYTLKLSARYAVSVMLTSGGYPDEFDKGFEIFHTERASACRLFYAGVKEKDGKLLTNGGRVIAVTSVAATLEDAMALAYDNARIIDFKGKYYRRDIGKDLL